MFQHIKRSQASFLSSHQQCQYCSYYKKSPSACHSDTHSLWRRNEHPVHSLLPYSPNPNCTNVNLFTGFPNSITSGQFLSLGSLQRSRCMKGRPPQPKLRSGVRADVQGYENTPKTVITVFISFMGVLRRLMDPLVCGDKTLVFLLTYM